MQEIIVYDSNDNPLTLLVQWDSNVCIHIYNSDINTNYPVHFYNAAMNESLVVNSEYDDSKNALIVEIPNVLLTQAYTINGYVNVVKDKETRCIYNFRIGVRKKPKPIDYIYVDNIDYIKIADVLDEIQKSSKVAYDFVNEAAGHMFYVYITHANCFDSNFQFIGRKFVATSRNTVQANSYLVFDTYFREETTKHLSLKVSNLIDTEGKCELYMTENLSENLDTSDLNKIDEYNFTNLESSEELSLNLTVGKHQGYIVIHANVEMCIIEAKLTMTGRKVLLYDKNTKEYLAPYAVSSDNGSFDVSNFQELNLRIDENNNNIQQLLSDVDNLQKYIYNFSEIKNLTNGQTFDFSSEDVSLINRISLYYDNTTNFINAPNFLPVKSDGKGVLELNRKFANEGESGLGVDYVIEETITVVKFGIKFVRYYNVLDDIWSDWRTLTSPYLGVEVTKDSPTTINILSELQAHFPWAKSFPSAVVYSNSSAATPAYFDGENLILSTKPAKTVTYCLEFSDIPLIGTIRK